MNEILRQYEELCKELDFFENEKIPLCAAETYVSDFCKRPLLSNFEGKYSFMEANGKNSFIGGQFVYNLNKLLSKECKRLFHANYTNADTITGINCFTVCAMSLLKRNNHVLITSPEQGGHASIPIILDSLGVQYDSIPFNYTEYQIDYKNLEHICMSGKYDFLIFCQSDIINPPDLSQIKIPESMGIIYDGTQTLGLIASNIVPNPLDTFHNLVLIGGTHKTLPAPACGLIMTNNHGYEELLKRNITPNFLRNTQPNHIASLLLALIEQEECGYAYQKLTVHIANQLGTELSDLGFDVVRLSQNEYTKTHQLFIKMSQTDTDAFYITAEKYNITLNKKHKRLFDNNGIRIGTQQVARYNWDADTVKLLATLLFYVKVQDDTRIKQIRKELILLKNPCFTYEDLSIK